MAGIWNIELYETDNGRCPTQEFVDGLDPKTQVHVLKALDRLGQYGAALQRPYVAPLRDKISELRIRTNQGQFRILYFRDRNTLVTLQGFPKNEGAVPDAQIDRAIEYRADYLARQRRGSR